VRYDFLALLAGLLLPLAFAPFDAPFVAVVSLALLFTAWVDATPGQAFRRGYWFGFGEFGFGAHWLYYSLHGYGGASSGEAVGLIALFTLILSLYMGLAGWATTRFFPPHRALRVVVLFPAAWVLAEWLRGWSFSNFPWLQVGYSQIDTPLAGLAPIFGVFGVSWAVAVLAGLLLVAPFWAGRRRLLAVAAVLGLVLAGLGLGHIPWTRPAGEPFKATLIQGNTPQNLKWQPEYQIKTFETYAELTRQHWESRLIVWPETAVPAFFQQIRVPLLAPLDAEAQAHGTDILLGIPYYVAAGDQYFNSIVALGRTPGVYLKRHLVPFGEYLPFRPILGWVLDILEIPLSDFAAGTDQQQPLQAAGYPMAGSVCYEDVFGHESRLNLPAAAFLVNVTNDAWFGDSIAPHQHIQMARMRALETGRWLLRASNSGVTAFVDPQGRITARLPLFRQDTLTQSIVPMQGATPYVLWGDWPVILGAAGLLAGMYWRQRRLASRAG
jgi:apolipoprotein N-acyltransferase